MKIGRVKRSTVPNKTEGIDGYERTRVTAYIPVALGGTVIPDPQIGTPDVDLGNQTHRGTEAASVEVRSWMEYDHRCMRSDMSPTKHSCGSGRQSRDSMQEGKCSAYASTRRECDTEMFDISDTIRNVVGEPHRTTNQTKIRRKSLPVTHI